MREQTIITERGTIYYWLSDQWESTRDTLFFFPGLTADHTMFAPQFDYFEGKYNLITWDAPCHGKSRPYALFSFEDISQAIVSILHQTGVSRVIGVGQSLGGYSVQALMKRHPQLVQAFIGIGTTPYGKQYYSASDKFWLRQVGWISMCYPLQMMKQAIAKQATCTLEGYDNMIAMTACYGKREYCHLMQMAYDAFLADNSDLVWNCPVLITYGEYEHTAKVRMYCDMWHKQTGFPLAVIKHASHNANVDNPVEMNRIIQTFLYDNFGE